MKPKYVVVILFLIFGFVAFEGLVLFSPLGQSSRLENAIQSAAVFAALLAAAIALSATDPKRQTVRVRIEPSIDSEKDVLIHTTGPNVIGQLVRQMVPDLPDPPKSYRVYFNITNVSGFTWENPTLTFRLPLDKRHPHEDYQEPTFRSNLFNHQADVRTLTFADTFILSNSNLPYWNDQDHATIWIRMLLGELEPFTVEVSVNCEAAEGVTETVSIDPKRWLE